VADIASGLRIIDVTNPQSPIEVGYCRTPGEANGVAIFGAYAYVADGDDGLRIIDVTNPHSPTEAGYHDTPGTAFGLAVSEMRSGTNGRNYVFMADDDGGLRIIDVTNPQSPTEVGYCSTPGYAWGVAVSGDYAYVADFDAGLQVIELAGVGVEEARRPLLVDGSKPTATVIRGTLWLPAASSLKPQASSCLLDIAGREVMRLRPGSNDVSQMAPGVYFVKEQPQASGIKSQAVCKVILTR
jgi:hypothetical protein